jgi:hypothetical protein
MQEGLADSADNHFIKVGKDRAQLFNYRNRHVAGCDAIVAALLDTHFTAQIAAGCDLKK